MGEIESLGTREPLDRHIERHRTDRLIMLSDGIFAIATTLAALEIKLPEHAESLEALLREGAGSLTGYLLSFVFTAVFWFQNRELFARVARTDTILTILSLGLLCGIAIIPAAVHVFYIVGGLAVGFKFYSGVMLLCGTMNSAMWIYAAARPGVMRDEIPQSERWTRAVPTLFMPLLFLLCLLVTRDQIPLLVVPVALVLVVVRRIVVPRLAAKAVDSRI